MLTTPEKIILVLLTLASFYLAYRAADRIIRIIRRGTGSLATDNLGSRIANALVIFVSQRTVLKRRFWPSLAHAFIAWGFTYYILVNIGDGLQGLLGGFVFLGTGLIGNVYRLLADLLSVGVLVGMTAMLVRRLVVGKQVFGFNAATKLHPKAVYGIRRDSLIVAVFILFHVGSRFLGESTHLVESGPDGWQPFASLVSGLWSGVSAGTLTFLQHFFFWGAIGSILLFIPYFLYSKHIHLFFAPINYTLKPKRRSIGELDKINFEDESIEQFGASKLEHLSQAQLLDAYACIMCNRCQDACPANHTGKVLSPSALEINKRYHMNLEGAAIASGKESEVGLLDFAISPEAVWACTTCGACIEACPVDNEPMRDILDIRRSLVLMDNSFPQQWQQAFRGMERTGNQWTISPDMPLDCANDHDAVVVS